MSRFDDYSDGRFDEWSDGLFDMAPCPRLVKGDKVRVHTMWGHEDAVVTGVVKVDGYPMAQLELASGDLITTSVARCTLVELKKP